ncbi:hypothetical protein [Reichenbachiella sp. MALMAid0571]
MKKTKKRDFYPRANVFKNQSLLTAPVEVSLKATDYPKRPLNQSGDSRIF